MTMGSSGSPSTWRTPTSHPTRGSSIDPPRASWLVRIQQARGVVVGLPRRSHGTGLDPGPRASEWISCRRASVVDRPSARRGWPARARAGPGGRAISPWGWRRNGSGSWARARAARRPRPARRASRSRATITRYAWLSGSYGWFSRVKRSPAPSAAPWSRRAPRRARPASRRGSDLRVVLAHLLFGRSDRDDINLRARARPCPIPRPWPRAGAGAARNRSRAALNLVGPHGLRLLHEQHRVTWPCS